MAFRIVNDKRYSRGRWRVVGDNGEAIQVLETINTQNGQIKAMMPFCEDTKEEILRRLLNLVEAQNELIGKYREQLAASRQG